MNTARTITILAAVVMSAIAPSVWAVSDSQHDSHHPAGTATINVAQATPAAPAMGMGKGMGMRGTAMMPGNAEHLKGMRAMHEKMTAASTPEERSALMAEQMQLMQSSMGTMEHMGPGAMSGKPGDMAVRQGMMEKRMDMMQSMMQMMIDRMEAAPATK